MNAPAPAEVWLRGPQPGVPPLLQPVAHTLLQALEEVKALMEGFPEELLWVRPAGVASPGFHLQHLTGVLDRLFTYAKRQTLSPLQLESLAAEGHPPSGSEQERGERGSNGVPGRSGVSELVERFSRQVGLALLQLKTTDETELTQIREVGRARIPSTLLGLLFHAGEHTQRHYGQLLVTVRVLQDQGKTGPSGNLPVKGGV